MVQVMNTNKNNFSDCATTADCCSTICAHSQAANMRKPFFSSTENELKTSKNKMRLGWWTRNWTVGTSIVVLLAIIVIVLPVTTNALKPHRGPPHPPPPRRQLHGHPPRRGPRPPPHPRQIHHDHPHPHQHHGPGRPPRGPNPHGYPHVPMHPNQNHPNQHHNNNNNNNPHSHQNYNNNIPHSNPNHNNIPHNNQNHNIPHPNPTQMSRPPHLNQNNNPLVTPTAFAKHQQQNTGQNSQLRKGSSLVQDLTPAAQTLYDLRGFNIPLGQQETQRYLRQQQEQHQQQLNNQARQQNVQEDLFQGPRPSPQNLFQSIVPPAPQQDPRTAPLVFPSFYQQQPRPQQLQPQAQIQLQHQANQNNGGNIFGHTQHLQQTKFEPQGFINTVEDPGPGNFRPSQVDHSGSTTTENSFKPVVRGEPKTILNYQAPQSQTRPANNNNIANTNSANSDEPFVYVYDDVEYEDDDLSTENKNTKTKNSFFSTAAPAKARGNPSTTTSTVLPTPLSQHQGHQTPFQPTLAPTQQQRQHQNNFFFDNDFDPRLNLNFNHNQHNQQQHNPFEAVPPPSFLDQGRHRNPPAVTPRPNVEIVPSSERKPPPDQSNAISPTVRNHNNLNQQSSRPTIDDRHRRPSASTTSRPQIPTFLQEQNNFEDDFNPPQYRRPQQQPQRNQFGAIIDNNQNDNDDNHQQFFNQNHPDPILIQKLNPFLNPDPFHPPSRLRPVNTIVPKNRVPQEDIVLPPHFPELEDNRTPKDEETTTTAAPITRKPIDSAFRRNPGITRTRGNQEARQPQHNQAITRGTTSTTTTTTTTTLAPRRVVRPERPERPKLRPSNRFTTTTAPPTTTSVRTTTLVPGYYEDVSNEYYEDLKNQNIQDTYDFDTPVTKSRTPAPSKQNSFANYDDPPEPPNTGRRVQPVRPLLQNVTPTQNALPNYSTTGKSRINHHQRFRETPPPQPPTAESPPPKKTGKPLYVAGKMLAKEGGLYAGQSIAQNHIYGSPAPLNPIQNIFDRPSMFDSHVGSHPSFNNNNNINQQQINLRRPNHLQNQHQNNAVSEAPHTSSFANNRLRLKPTTTSTTKSNSISHGHVRQDHGAQINGQSNDEDFEQARARPKPRFQTTRQPVQSQQSQSSQSQGQGPRRRRPRPNQQKRVEDTSPPPQTEVVSIHAEVSQEVRTNNHNNYQSELPQAQFLSSTPPPVELTTTPRALVNLRSRRPRPKFQTTTAAPEEEEKPLNLPKPPRKLKRVRPRVNNFEQQLTTPQPEYSESVSIVTQSSVKISKKPTEAPGRFSSRYRGEDIVNVVSTPPGEVTSADTPRFNQGGGKPRPTFRPPKSQKPKFISEEPSSSPFPVNQKPKRVRPQQQQQQQEAASEDALPASILLSPKDVVMNRKPARRIPPGSASDRLKALQERRKKIAIRKQGGGGEEGQNENGGVVRRVRVRTQPRPQPQQQDDQDYHNDNLEQPTNKREIHSGQNAPAKEFNELKEYEEGEVGEDDYEHNSPKNLHQSLNLNVRNTSEVTSEEARSVLGIRIPLKTYANPTLITESPAPIQLQSPNPRKSSTPLFESLEVDDEDHKDEEQVDGYHYHEDTGNYDDKEENAKHSVKQSTMQQWTPAESIQSTTQAKLLVSPRIPNSPNKPIRENVSSASPPIVLRQSSSFASKLRPQFNTQGSVQQKRISHSSSSSSSSTLVPETPQRSSSAVSLQKFLKRPVTTSSSNSQSSIFTMATEDPSLPLESIFPIVPYSVTTSSSSSHSSS